MDAKQIPLPLPLPMFAELQLKPNHVPFKLACYWEELLHKHVKADDEDIERGTVSSMAKIILLHSYTYILYTVIILLVNSLE